MYKVGTLYVQGRYSICIYKVGTLYVQGRYSICTKRAWAS